LKTLLIALSLASFSFASDTLRELKGYYDLDNLVCGVIRSYQKISYNLPLKMCVYDPSCSHFAQTAIRQKGAIISLPIISDRLIRCNPFVFANKTKPFVFENRYFDPVELHMIKQRDFRFLYLLPGIFQFKNLQYGDGISAIILITVPALLMAKNKSPVFAIFSTTFYFGHIHYCFTF
jgi:putative component of membrane protein insertase Oxa1/YidC/SpoIIIJ protein YidD